jgi:hypothetical protein
VRPNERNCAKRAVLSAPPHRPERRIALSSDAKSTPLGWRTTYSGLMPSRSRATNIVDVRRSMMQKAYIPTRRSTHRLPHCAYAARSTSVSPDDTKRWPSESSSVRSST